MKIKEVPLQKPRSAYSRYGGLCEKVRDMKVNTAIEVTLDDSCLNLSTTLQQIFRRGRYSFKITTRKLDFKGYRWYIEKVKEPLK